MMMMEMKSTLIKTRRCDDLVNKSQASETKSDSDGGNYIRIMQYVTLYIPPIKLSTIALNSAESNKGTQLSGRLRRPSFCQPAGEGAPTGGGDDAGRLDSTTITSSVPRSRSIETFS